MLEPGTVMDLDGIAGRGGRLPAEIQSGEAAQPTGLREPGDFCGAELSIPSSGRASPSLRWGWTKNKQKLNHVPGLTHGLDQKSEPGHLHCDPTASHYLRMLLDGIFGAENFRNDIVWKRKAGRGETNNA